MNQRDTDVHLSLRLPVPSLGPPLSLSIQSFRIRESWRGSVAKSELKVEWPQKYRLRLSYPDRSADPCVDLRDAVPAGAVVVNVNEGQLTLEASADAPSSLDKPWRIPRSAVTMDVAGELVVAITICAGVPCADRFAITAGWYTPVAPQLAAERILSRPAHPDDPLANIFTPLDDVVVGQMRVSLLDPCSLSRVVAPVRCEDCRHPQFFDLHTFLAMNRATKTHAPKWTCPLPGCHASARNGRSLVPSPVARRLLAAHPAATSVTLFADGTTCADGEVPAPPSEAACDVMVID